MCTYSCSSDAISAPFVQNCTKGRSCYKLHVKETALMVCAVSLLRDFFVVFQEKQICLIPIAQLLHVCRYTSLEELNIYLYFCRYFCTLNSVAWLTLCGLHKYVDRRNTFEVAHVSENEHQNKHCKFEDDLNDYF